MLNKIIFLLLISTLTYANTGIFEQRRVQSDNKIHTFYQMLPDDYDNRRNKTSVTYIYLSDGVNGDDFLRAVPLTPIFNDNHSLVVIWDLKNRQWNIQQDEQWIKKTTDFLKTEYPTIDFKNVNVISYGNGQSIANNFICDNMSRLNNWVHVGDMDSLNCEIKNINFMNVLEDEKQSKINTILDNNNCEFKLGSQKRNYGYVKSERCKGFTYQLHSVVNMGNKWPGSQDTLNNRLYLDKSEFNTLFMIEDFLF